MTPTLPLILGGHSFIAQLGSDPFAREDEQIAIVSACMDAGITTFDTTYRPERLALGRCLRSLGRRAEARIIAWNFFHNFAPGEEVGGPEAYRPEHIDAMLADLGSDFVDDLVIHAVNDPRENDRQRDLAMEWQRQGLVRRLGVWHPGTDAKTVYGSINPYAFMVRPWNLTTPEAAPAFAACKQLGWENIACSPFVRGWELDRLVQNLVLRAECDEDEARPRVADAMLRYALFQPDVDRLIVAIRRTAWVEANAQSVRRGPLSQTERNWLLSLWSEV
jgi:aryl-alcohol dehydrogenase-like predicted oxidoreductase